MMTVALGLWFLSTVTVTTGYPTVLIALMVLGTGMAWR